MNGGGHGRVDCAGGWIDGLRYFVSLIALAAFASGAMAGPVQDPRGWGTQGHHDFGPYATGADAGNACNTQRSNWPSDNTIVGDFNACTSNTTDGGVTFRYFAYEHCDGNCWTTEYHYEVGCEAGAEVDPDTGECLVNECEAGETITTGFEGTGLSVCTNGCNYNTTHGMDPLDGTGSYIFDGNGFTSSNLPQRYGVWTNDGTQCTAGEIASNSITTDQGTTLDLEQDQPNCGTVNGERFCAESIPDGGKCTFIGSNGYVCGSASDQPVVPPHDPSTTTVTETDAITFEGATGEHSRLTISTGTIDTSTPSDGLDEGTTTPEAGSDDAQEEQPGFCEENPSMCDLDDGLGDQPTVPEQTMDLGALMDSYTSGVPDAAECPPDETVNVFATSFVFPWSSFCAFADRIRPLVIAAAFLSAFIYAVRALA